VLLMPEGRRCVTSVRIQSKMPSACWPARPARPPILAGGSDLLVRMQGGFVETRSDRRHQGDRRAQARIKANGGRIQHRCCRPLRRAGRKRGPEEGVARRRRGGQADRLEAGAGGAAPSSAISATPRRRPDSVPALIAAGAMALIAGQAGRRTIPVASVPTGPGKNVAGQRRDHRGHPARRAPAALRHAYLRFIPTHGDGLSRWSAPGEPAASMSRVSSRRPRVALGAWRRRCFWWKRPPMSHRHEGDEATRVRLRQGLCGGLPSHRRTSEAQ